MITLPKEALMVILRVDDDEKALDPLWIRVSELREGDLVYDKLKKHWGAVAMVGDMGDVITVAPQIRVIDFPKEYLDLIEEKLKALTKELIDNRMIDGLGMMIAVPEYLDDFFAKIIPIDAERALNAHQN